MAKLRLEYYSQGSGRVVEAVEGTFADPGAPELKAFVASLFVLLLTHQSSLPY